MAALTKTFTVSSYNLDATLGCGQAFRWERSDQGWTGIVRGRWIELIQSGETILARAAVPQSDWTWLAHYLQLDVSLESVIATFPDDPPLRAAVQRCHGLRLLRQEPWECLASFILSSTKQIVQIRQVIRRLCERHGKPVTVPPGNPAAFAFPDAAQITTLTEPVLRACQMGFRAPHLLHAARRVANGELDLNKLPTLSLLEARNELLHLPGVGPKIADCVLLFAGGFPTAFPVDVWVIKALRRYYFRNRGVPLARLREFSATHFGPHGGFAQQYLFHSLRLAEGKAVGSRATKL